MMAQNVFIFLNISTTHFKYYPIQQAKQFRKSLKSEKERLGESFEIKLRRAQGLYESELTAAKVRFIRFIELISTFTKIFYVQLLYSRELHALKDHEGELILLF